jgi:O-acetyl-ADP-ribose deacetylase (regulator of RNase III)
MNKAKITCVVGNLIKQTDCDAIVNSAHPSMLAGSGVCGAIHRAAGKVLEVYGKQFAPLKPNQAVITPGFDLDIKHIIHVSAPRHHIAADPLGELADALRNVFKLAEEHQIQKIALPAICTGVYGYPMIEAIRVYTSVSMEFSNSEILEEIRFVFTETESMDLMKSHLNQSGGNHTLAPLKPLPQ